MQAIRPIQSANIDQSAFTANLARAMLGQTTRTYGAAQPAPRTDASVQVGVAFVFQSRITVTVGVYGTLDAWGVAQIVGNSSMQAHQISHAIESCACPAHPDNGAHPGQGTKEPVTPPVTTPPVIQPEVPHDNGNHNGQDKTHSNNGNHYGQIKNGNNGRFHVTA